MARPITHHTEQSLRERCVEEGDCLIWQGYLGNRTPMVMHAGKLQAVRRLFTQLLKGEAKPQGYHELGEIKALSSKTWNHPTLAGHFLLVRNDREAVCYLLP